MYYKYQDFSKFDKKLFQPLVQLGAQRQIEQFLKESLSTHQNIVSQNHEDIRQPFWDYFENFKEFAQNLKRTYDGVNPKNYPNLIASLLVKNHLSAFDVSDFSTEGRKQLQEMENRINEY